MILPKSSFHCSIIPKAPSPSFHLLLRWTTLRKLPTPLVMRRKKRFAAFYSTVSAQHPATPSIHAYGRDRRLGFPPAATLARGVLRPAVAPLDSPDFGQPHLRPTPAPSQVGRPPCTVPGRSPSELQHRPPTAASTGPQRGWQPQPRVHHLALVLHRLIPSRRRTCKVRPSPSVPNRCMISYWVGEWVTNLVQECMID
jgi:hypothetical protein